MKGRLLIVFLVIFLAGNALAQEKKASPDTLAQSGLITICEKVVSVTVNHNANNETLMELGDYYPKQVLMVIIKGADRIKFKILPELFFVGKRICVTGKMTAFNGKPAIELTDPEMITEDSAKRKVDTIRRVKITNVVLSPPPFTRYFGERYRRLNLTALDSAGRDTIKVIEKIKDYKLTNKEALINFGDKLTVVIKGQAKLYLDAMLQVQYKNSDSSHVLNGKKFFVVGKVSHVNGKPRIVISNPSLFAILD